MTWHDDTTACVTRPRTRANTARARSRDPIRRHDGNGVLDARARGSARPRRASARVSMTWYDDTTPCVTRPRIRATAARVRSRAHDAARRYDGVRDAPADPREHGERQQEAHAARRGRHDRRVEDQPAVGFDRYS